MKKVGLRLFLILAGCTSPADYYLNPKTPVYPKQNPTDIQIVRHTDVEPTCQLISAIISEPDSDIPDILKDIREKASEQGGNLVYLENLDYVPNSDTDKYMSATVYFCPKE